MIKQFYVSRISSNAFNFEFFLYNYHIKYFTKNYDLLFILFNSIEFWV